MFVHYKKMTTPPDWRFIGLVVIALLVAACVVQSVPAPTPSPTEPLPTATPEPPTPTPEPPTPTPEPSTPTPEPPTATPTSGAQSGAINMDEIFPPDHETETELLIYTCGSCHSWVCAVIGQRPVEHWRTVQATHKDLVSALSDEEDKLLFDFLAENFNDTKPEPDLPAVLRDQGCTTQ